MKQAHAAMLVTIAIAASHCGGAASTPTSPSSPGTSAPIPAVRAVTVTRTNIEAGEEITVSASVDGVGAPGQLRYVWSVQPNAGMLTPEGPTLRWKAPVSDPVPATYVFSVTLVQSSQTAIGPPAATTQNGAASSPPVFVNDARREMISQSELFLRESAESSVSPDAAVRNFTDSCPGKQAAIEEIAANRAAYSAASVSFDLQMFVRSIEWANCTAADGSARCALLIYDAAWSRTRRADSVQETVTGTEYVQGFYEGNRWWLCGARFEQK